jgi:hypothetical protein
MPLQPTFFSRPADEPHCLQVPPAVASWDKAGSAGQRRVTEFVDHACELVTQEIEANTRPLVLGLDVGLPADTDLYDVHDLDNFLLPLTQGLTKRTGRSFASVWATKRHATRSLVRTGDAREAPPENGARYAFDLTVSASSQTTAYKEAIRDQVAAPAPLPGDGVSLQLAFVVGPTRSWLNLWKPTIDALGAILGRDAGAREWNARDGRIVELGLHCVIDQSAGNDVRIAVRADPAPPVPK